MQYNLNLCSKIAIVLIIVFMFGCSTSQTIREKPQTTLAQAPDSTEIIPENSSDSAFLNTENIDNIFDLLFSEAKSFYVEALIAGHFNDTSEVKYCFERSFEIIAGISELDTLTALQKDDFERFYEKITSDFQTKFSYLNGDSGSYGVALVRQELGQSLLDTVRISGDELIVLDDRPGHFPIVSSQKIKRIINYFQTREHERFQQWLDNSGLYKDHMLPILREQGLPDELFYLALIESGFNPVAYSYAHAAGPWQFIASTGARYGLKRNWWVDERRDPVKSTYAAAKYLKTLHDMFNDWFLALAAYNCGEGKVFRAIRREGTRDYWNLQSLPKQTRNYIPTLMAGITIAMNPEEYGFSNAPKAAWEWDEIVLERSYELEAIARESRISAQEIREYNPELRRWTTPPDVKEYVLRLPTGKGAGLKENLVKLPEAAQEPQWGTHRVGRGQTLSYIAKKYGTTVSALIAANNIRNQNQIKVGQNLVIPSSNHYIPEYSTPKGKDKIIHIVKKGETLGQISDAYGVSLSKVRAWNNLYGRRFIYPGQKIQIFAESASEPIAGEQREGNKITHIIRKGESLSFLADRYKVSVNELKNWNNLNGTRYIYPGQKIVVYSGSTVAAVQTNQDTVPDGKIVHVVRKGETLSQIADRYGVGLSKVKAWNNLNDSRFIYPGQKIVIYTTAANG